MNTNPSPAQAQLLVLLGPTAVGKSSCGVELAAKLNGEIISADSMQFYKYLNIGTAKITQAEMYSQNNLKIPHHLIDIISPEVNYSVADFQQDATSLVLNLNKNNKLPILVGGTGLYISALIDGYNLETPIKEDISFREAKKQEYALRGGQALLTELAAVDPVAAGRINVNDQKRLIRALEVYYLTGIPFSEQVKKNQPDWKISLFGITMNRELLYQRINQRVLKMVEDGFVEEVKTLLEKGYSPNLRPMQGLGYKQICSYLANEISLEEAIYLIQRDTRRFAKRQLTWWRKDSRVHWFEVTENTKPRDLADQMAAFYANNF